MCQPQNQPITENITEMENDKSATAIKVLNGKDTPAQERTEAIVNAKKLSPENKQSTTNTPKSTNLKEDWASLMFHSDDSLFDEMTKQLENTATNT